MEPFVEGRRPYQRLIRCRAVTERGIVRALARVLGYRRMPKRFEIQKVEPVLSESGLLIHLWEITLRGKLWLAARTECWLVVEPLGDDGPEDDGGTEKEALAA